MPTAERGFREYNQEAHIMLKGLLVTFVLNDYARITGLEKPSPHQPMRIAQISFSGFRGLNSGQVTLPPHGVLLGGNNVGKTAIVEALALVFGRERVTSQITDWDFFGGLPQPDTRFTIVCTITDFATNITKDHPNWFLGEQSAHPVWWNEATGTVTYEPDCPSGGALAAQIALCGRYDEETCEFETKRYFYSGSADPFTQGCETVTSHRIEELGVFIIPSNRQWDRLMSFASSTFVKALRQSGAVPGTEIEKLKLELRNPDSPIEHGIDFSKLLASAEIELRDLMMLKGDSNLVYRTTSLDTPGVLQNLLPHVKDASGTLLPLSKHGAGMVSLQSFLVVLAIAQKRKSSGKNFILVAEEPELHLHPSLHKRLANRIRAVSSQSVVTTHSPLVASAYKPTESILVRNQNGDLTAERLRNEPIGNIPSNTIRRLYLQKRELFYEAILGAAVLVPEGESDFEWLRHLQRMVEGADGVGLNFMPLSVVPTQDASIVETYVEVARFHTNILPLVDGDDPGRGYADKLRALPVPPRRIAQLGEGAGAEILAAWILEPCLNNAGSWLKKLLPDDSKRTLKGLQHALETAKKDRELRENLVWEALGTKASVERAADFLRDLADILALRKPRSGDWQEMIDASGPCTYIARHICKA